MESIFRWPLRDEPERIVGDETMRTWLAKLPQNISPATECIHLWQLTRGAKAAGGDFMDKDLWLFFDTISGHYLVI